MSRLSDYSKFDHLVDSEDEEEATASTPSISKQQPDQSQYAFVRHPQHESRFILKHQGNSIYEWEQTLNDVTIYIMTPDISEGASGLVCDILPNRLRIGLRGSGQYFLNETTGGTVDVENSTWTWESRLLTVELQKANKGIVWETVCQGAEGIVSLDPMQLEQERQRLLLERWQEENPGMDFRGATFNGSAPDPRTYMGGVRYD